MFHIIKLKGKKCKHYVIELCDLMHNPALLSWVKRSDNEIVQYTFNLNLPSPESLKLQNKTALYFFCYFLCPFKCKYGDRLCRFNI